MIHLKPVKHYTRNVAHEIIFQYITILRRTMNSMHDIAQSDFVEILESSGKIN